MNKLPCRHGKCGGELAGRYPKINMTAVGQRRGPSSRNFVLFMPIPVCRTCSPAVSVQDFLLPEGRERIAAAMQAMGKARPDFDRAWLTWGRIGDSDWLTYHQIEAQGKTRQ